MGDRTVEGDRPRVRVPWCRAHDDPCLRSGRAAFDRVRLPLRPRASPLRDEFPPDRHPRVDRVVLAHPPARDHLAGGEPDTGDPGHRRVVVRAVAFLGTGSGAMAESCPRCTRDVAPETHHKPACRRSDRSRHRFDAHGPGCRGRGRCHRPRSRAGSGAGGPEGGAGRVLDHGLAARLEEVEEAFREVEAQLADPATGSDPSRYAELGRRHAELGAIVDLLEQWRRAMTDRSEALELAAEDPEMAPELKRLADEREAEAERLEAELRRAMIPKDPNDDKDVILEIRAAAGGDEAAIWAGDLLRMYERFAESEGFKIEPMESSPSEAGGYNRVVVAVKGRGAYSRLKYEAGVHRVQRVPKTESQGRIHTSTATVA